jgi:hypothetical protein
MTIYKISYVVPDQNHPGGIINLDHHPELGEILTIGNVQYRVRETIELIPPQGKFRYLHVTCEIV